MQKYQDDHKDEVEIINLRKRYNKTGAKAETKRDAKAKADSKTGAKAASKAPRSRYDLFLREQLEKVTGEDRKYFRSIVSERWKKIKEDPVRLFIYNNRARQMRDEAEKPTKSGDDLSVGSMVPHEETVTESSMVKRKQREPPKSTKISTVC